MTSPRAALLRFQRALEAGRFLDAATQIADAHPGSGLLRRPVVAVVGTSPMAASDIEDIRSAPSIVEAIYELGVALWGTDGNELLAIKVLEHAAELGSKRAAATLGESLLWFGDYEGAVRWLRAAANEPLTDSAWIRGLLGEAIFEGSDDPREAETHLTLGYAEYQRFGLPLARILISDGRYDQAREILGPLVVHGVYGAAVRLGNLLDLHFDDADGAKRAYRAGIDSGDGHSAYNLGVMYEDEGAFDEADNAFLTARALGDLTEPPQRG